MNPQNLSRLKEEQQKALNATNANIQQWEKFRSDYKSLKSRLKTLPDKVTHEVMVPFGPLAFMPGQLVHTNEILVLLGDNWFVERSAKQACGIVDRRLKSVNKEIEDLEKQKQLLEPRLDAMTKQFSQQSDTFEITEEYDEEKEKKWRVQHRKNVKAYRKSCQEKPADDTKPLSDEELWARLDELERIESERREMHKITSDEVLLHKSYDSDDSILSIESGSDSGDLDTNDLDNQETSSSGNGDTDDEGSGSGRKTRLIRFTHTATKKIETEDSTDTDDVTIQSPADIFSKLYQHSGPKSILKNNGQKGNPVESVTFDLGETQGTSLTETSKAVAFSGAVVERTTENKPTVEKESETSQDQPVRISRFKARRRGLDQT